MTFKPISLPMPGSLSTQPAEQSTQPVPDKESLVTKIMLTSAPAVLCIIQESGWNMTMDTSSYGLISIYLQRATQLSEMRLEFKQREHFTLRGYKGA